MIDHSVGILCHYANATIVARVLAALGRTSEDKAPLTPEMLYPLDQLHGGGLAATRKNVAQLGLGPSHRVLDVGCGAGGPARYMAATFGCHVTGIDLTQDFVAAAIDLTARCGLGERVAFRQNDALALPFADASFDAATCLNVTMNIADKEGVAREIARVLQPGGRVVWTELARGRAGAPPYPLPWARAAEISFLVAPEELRRAVERAGFRIMEWIDETAEFIAQGARAAADPQASSGPALTSVIMGDDFSERAKNSQRGLRDGSLIAICFVAAVVR